MPTLTVFMAPQIGAESWLNEPEHEWFRTLYRYASTQTRSIPALAALTPEDAYWLYSILRHAETRFGGKEP